ncbi:MAG: VIT domain-containing protein [Thermoguttaceae bacterium]|jgi:tetratricopeptide (TPR) repeat protein|nr:VIT domain-containing protein [Thermoguttaceae bacterium]
MRRFLPCLLMVLFTGPLAAQTVPPTLVVEVEEGKARPLGLSVWATEVRIFGYLAETTTTMTFRNPLDREMEGDLYFPLPAGATVSGYALDVDGKMVDGVAVGKHRGRQVFEEIVRQGIDPGLVEWTKGNNFKTRVFPIPARGTRTVRVSYVSEVIVSRGESAYHLPLRFTEKLDRLSVRVEVVKPLVEPQVVGGELGNFAFGRWRDSYVAEATLEDVAPSNDLVIALPRSDEQNVLVEETPEGQVYFAVRDFPHPPRSERPADPPQHVVLIWDASGSRAAADHEREIGLLAACFDAWRNRMPGRAPTILVDLVLLRHRASEPSRFELAGSDPEALLAELRKVEYDGGTQMGELSSLGGDRKPDFYLLFSDGISTFGKQSPGPFDAPLYAFSTGTSADHAFLQSLAMGAEGQYFNLAEMTDQDVVAEIGRSAWSFLSAESGGADAAVMVPAVPQPVAGRFTLVGKLAADEATVTLHYGYPGERVRQQAFTIARTGAAEGSLLERLWAQKKLADLMIAQDRNEAEITALGKQFGLVTPFTSLIVLDSLEQYLNYEIVPPKSLPEMRDEYLRRMDTVERQKKTDQQQRQAEKLEQVVQWWQERVQWWEAEYAYPEGFKYEQPEGDRRHNMLMPAPGGGAAPEGPSAEPAMRERLELLDETPSMGGAFGCPVSPMEAGVEPRDEMGDVGGEPGIVVKPWDPATPYLADLKAVADAEAFAVYMRHRAEYGASPGFYLDCADHFLDRGDRDLALQVLSNIAELHLEEPALLRVLAHRLAQLGFFDLAVVTFEEVLRLRPEEPQSYRDLALVLIRRADEAASPAPREDYARAVGLLYEVVLGQWDGRFEEIELIALVELNGMLPRARAAGVDEVAVDERLLKLLDVDVRISMSWHADNTDIDLWVTEPSGEKADYSHNRTTIGGMITRDFTGGYGPEDYLLRKAMKGMYTIQANFYGSQATRLLGAVTVQVDVFTHFGRPNQKRKSLTVRLKDADDTVTIGQIEF